MKIRIILIICFMVISIVTSADEDNEFHVKSAFMLKMTHFIDWPEDSLVNDENEEFVICVEHEHDYDDGLQTWAETGLIKNKKVKVEYFHDELPGQGRCDIIYISEKRFQKKYVEFSVANKVLTISDLPGSVESGVIINFINVNNKLRFEVNLAVARQQGFKISPRLLRLATNVIGAPNE